MNVDVFIAVLFAISTLTGLFTECFKNLLKDMKVKFSSNILAGIISVILGIFFAVCYPVFIPCVIDSKYIITMIVLTILCWCCAMVGYDKVVQTLIQIQTSKE